MNNDIRPLIGQKIGTVTVREEIKNTRQYEFAAWSTDMTAVLGTYDLFIGVNAYNHINGLQVYAKLAAVVTDDNCAPHFGGVAFAPARKDRVGTADEFTFTAHPLAAIHMNNSRFPSGPVSYQLDLNTEVGREFCRVALQQSRDHAAHCEQALVVCVDERKWSMVAHYAKAIDSEESLQRCALYTMDGKNGDAGRVDMAVAV